MCTQFFSSGELFHFMAQVRIPPAACVRSLSSSAQQQAGGAFGAPRKRGSQGEMNEWQREQEEWEMEFFFPFYFPFLIHSVLCLFPSKPLEIVTDRSSVFQFLCQGVLPILWTMQRRGQARERESKRMTNSAELWLYHWSGQVHWVLTLWASQA